MTFLLNIIEPKILTWILFLPLVGGLIIFLTPKKCSRAICLLFALFDFVLSLHLPFHFDNSVSGLQFTEKVPWIPSFNIHYALGIDGISLWLILLATFLGPIVVLSSWNSIQKHPRGFYALLLMLQTGMLGAFMASDLFLFYVFWEAMLIPMYLIIGVWGGERRLYATMKFFIFTMAGSLFMFVGMIFLFLLYKQEFGTYSTDIQTLYQLDIPRNLQLFLFGAFALSFAIKVPVFTLHTWLPDAHVEAPTAGSVVLAGVLLKMGIYGFLRLAMPLFPLGLEAFRPLLMWLAVIGIVYGALVAMVQKDIKKLIAYSSVSHLGYILLGIMILNLQGLAGGIYQMLNHGISTGGLFLLIGMIYERTHTREIKEFGGLARSLPLLSIAFLLITLSSIGLPGLNGFVGEFLILLGTFRVDKLFCVIAGSGLILGAVYMLWLIQRVFFGPLKAKNARLVDLGFREGLILVPLLVLIFWMGVYPKPFLNAMDASSRELIRHIKENIGQNHLAQNENHQKIYPPSGKTMGVLPWRLHLLAKSKL